MSQKHDKLMQYKIIIKKATAYVCMYVCMYISCMYILFTIKLLSGIHLHLPPFLAKKLLEKCRRNMQSFLKLNAFVS